MDENMSSKEVPKLITAEDIANAKKCISETGLIYETPMLGACEKLFGLHENIELYLKLENMQTNGSFKLRGVVNQFDKKLKDKDTRELKLVTFSAGNYGKAFAFLCSQQNLKGKVLLPHTSAQSRIKFIQDKGLETQLYESGELLLKGVEEHVNNGGWELFHPIEDANLVSGYAPIATEILNKVENPDLVLVCCGGGALLAGISSGLSHLGCNALVYGVEPATANTMHQSFEKNHAVADYSSKSIGGGLAPPFAGKSAYFHCRKYVKEIILVSDDELIKTCKILFEKGLKVEPSGCAGMAALLFNKIPNIDVYQRDNQTKIKIVTVLTGGNVSAHELADLFQ